MYCASRDPSGEIMLMTIRKSGEALRTWMPSARTSCGRRASACETRFCTSTCAWSMSVPPLKTTLMVTRPSPVDCEVM